MVRLTVSNDGGFTAYQETTISADLDDGSDDNTGLIAGLVVSILVILVLVAVVACVLYRSAL